MIKNMDCNRRTYSMSIMRTFSKRNTLKRNDKDKEANVKQTYRKSC